MSENSIISIEPSLIHPFEKLKYLNLARNGLGNSISTETYGKSLFHALQMIEVLNFSDNAIQVIPKDNN